MPKLTEADIVRLIDLTKDEGWIGREASEVFRKVVSDDIDTTIKALQYVEAREELRQAGLLDERGSEGGDE